MDHLASVAYSPKRNGFVYISTAVLFGDKFETAVFPIKDQTADLDTILDLRSYATASEAEAGHIAVVGEWRREAV